MSNNASAKAIGTVLLPSIGDLIGDFVILNNMTWYESLKKPSLTPPPWVNAIIRITINTTLGLASYIIVRQGDNGVNVVLPLIVYFIQLLFYLSFPIIFFGGKNLYVATIISVVVAIGASVTTYLFNGIIDVAGQLLYPYIVLAILVAFQTMSFADLNRDRNANVNVMASRNNNRAVLRSV
ncbi:hypothetical protein Aperf_G00000122167 [Anoplocephala perfoliata]